VSREIPIETLIATHAVFALTRFVVCVATALVLCPVAHTVAVEAEWIQLFDGKTLEAWEKVGKQDSVWEVEDGTIHESGAAFDGPCPWLDR
jgi:3-keto-disaccharide hydrolase